MARILVIEDNPINLELMSYLLRAWGHEVRQATDGVAGLAAARRERPDLIVCDIQMPGLDGYEAARRIRGGNGSSARAPIVALTANAMAEDRARCLEAGMDDYVAKPFRSDDLRAMLERHGAKTGT